jgi:hypothetical protein
MIACCGLECTQCDTFKATKENDDSKRKETAQKWSRMFRHDISPEQINCDGCKSTTGRNFYFCGICEIRKCCMSKGVEHCAVCKEYICDKLAKFIKSAPRSGEALEKLRKASYTS